MELRGPWFEFTGLAATDCLGAPLESFAPEADRGYARLLLQALADGRLNHFHIVLPIRQGSGGAWPCNLRARAERDTAGRLLALVGEIDAIPQAAETLTIDGLAADGRGANPGEARFETDAEGRLSRLNQAWEEVTGRAIPRSLGLPLCDVIHPDDRRRCQAAIKPLFNGTLAFSRATFRLADRGDGEARFVELSVRALGDGRGRVLALTGRVEDVTERKQADDALRESEQRFRALADAAPVLVWMSDERGAATYFNRQWLNLTGRAPVELEGEGWLESVHPDDRVPRLSAQAAAAAAQAPFRIEYRLRRFDGEYRWVLDTGVPRAGTAGGYIGSGIDITDRRRAEEALRESEERWHFAVEGTGDGLWDWDLATDRVFYSDHWKALLGFTPDEISESPSEWRRRIHPSDLSRTLDALDAHLRGESPHYAVEHRLRCKDGSYKWVQHRGKAIDRDADGRALRLIGVQADISERKAQEAKIEELATRDTLTGLPNRLLLTDRLERALINARRKGDLMAIFFVDLDRFKTINDSLGHQVGDQLLKQVGERLLGAVRKGDTVARLGGDEFVLIFEGLKSSAEAEHLAQKLLAAVAQPYQASGHGLNTSGSVGISIYPTDASDVHTLLRNADTAMYHAKEQGPGNYRFFSAEMNARAVERLRLESGLRRALGRNEFRLVYQPQIDAATGLVVGIEALLRWQHGDQAIPPAQFIGIAEEVGLIEAIGEWALNTACQQARVWSRLADVPPRMGVNVSARQFNVSLVGRIKHALRASGLPAELLELEITEGLLMKQVDENRQILEQLGALGMQISVDDFGTGYSSLSYLRRFPIHNLKIDQSFVRDVDRDADAAAIVQAVVALARSLRLRVVAEGVETQEQFEAIDALGCDAYQGMLFSPPLSPDAFEKRFLHDRCFRLPGTVPAAHADSTVSAQGRLFGTPTRTT